MAGTDPLLVVNAIGAAYGGSVIALHRVSFAVGAGDFVALLGANGAGKSTTLKAVSNLLPAQRGRLTAGSIAFAGRDVLKSDPGALVRRGLAQVLEGRHCFRSLTVEENLVAGGIGRGSGAKALSVDLERVYAIFPRLRERRRTIAGLASGGEQQMLAIGRALMSRPRLLVLDEPSMGLAPLIVQEIFRTLTRLNRDEGLSLLVAEQNSAVALAYAHRAVVLENGVSAHEEDAATLRSRDGMRDFYLGRASRAA